MRQNLMQYILTCYLISYLKYSFFYLMSDLFHHYLIRFVIYRLHICYYVSCWQVLIWFVSLQHTVSLCAGTMKLSSRIIEMVTDLYIFSFLGFGYHNLTFAIDLWMKCRRFGFKIWLFLWRLISNIFLWITWLIELAMIAI